MPELFANRKPDDLPCHVIKLSLAYRDGRWKTLGRGTRSAKGLYIFVVQKGQLIVTRRTLRPDQSGVITRLDLASGNEVEFAGEILFGGRSGQRRIIKFWNDKTGHYHDPIRQMDPGVGPDLPQDRFERYSDTP